VLEQLAVVSSHAPRPVVMFTDDAKASDPRGAARGRLARTSWTASRPERLDPIMRVAMERFEADQALRAELEDTKTRLAERKVVERAKGILMKHRGIDEEAAYAALRTLAMERGNSHRRARQQVVDVAGLLG
jgi:response regulator NasT